MNPGELTGVLSRLSTGLLNLSKDPQMNLAFVWRRPTQIKTLITVGIWERGDPEPKILDFEDDVNQFKRYGIEGVVDCEEPVLRAMHPYETGPPSNVRIRSVGILHLITFYQ